MAIRTTSLRHLRFQLSTALVGRLPWLRDRVLMYRDVRPADDLASAEVITLRQPIALAGRDAEFARLLPDKPLQPIPAEFIEYLRLYRLEGVSLLGNTGVFADERARAVVTFPTMRQFVNYHYLRPEPLAPVDLPPGDYFNMLSSHRGHRHFFHFLFDRLPKLLYTLDRFGYGDRPLTVLVHEDLPRFQADIFRFLGEQHPRLAFRPVSPRTRVRGGAILHLDDDRNLKSTHVEPALIGRMRRLVFEGYGIDARPGGRRIYVSRADTRKRRLVNEAEIQALFEARGFEVVAPGTLGFENQVRLFAEAEMVAGVHGAGLTNILFSAPGTKVLEIFPAPKIKNTYFLLARSAGQPYDFAIGSGFGRHESFSVAADEVAAALDRLGDRR